MLNWRCAAAPDLPLIRSNEFEEDAAVRSIFEWAGWPDAPDPEKAQRCFLVFNADEPQVKGSYRLPFVEIVEDSPRANPAAIAHALEEIRDFGFPEAIIQEAESALARYTSAPEESPEPDGVLGFPARFIAPTEQRAILGLNPDQMLALCKARAADPSIFDEEGSTPYFWAAQISNNRQDTYYSRMQPSSLKNYAADADAGVAFQNSHNTRELPLGGSLKGKYTGASGNGVARVEALFYTIPGIQPGSVSSDQLIRMMRAGTVRDVSIGFYGGRSVCSICNADMRNWMECPHWPGDMVDITNAKGDVVDRVMAIELIEDARLAEVSGVYDGACPGAGIMKARMAAEAGNLVPEKARLLEQRYRIHLPSSRHTYNLNSRSAEGKTSESKIIVKDNTFEEAKKMNEKTTTTDNETGAAEETREQKPGTEGTPGVNPPAAGTQSRAVDPSSVRTLVVAGTLSSDSASQILAELDRLERENTRLAPLADDGKKYKASLIEEALKEGRRAQGEAFPEETFRSMLMGSTVENIIAVRDSYAGKAAETFKGGRSTRDGAEDGKQPKEGEVETKGAPSTEDRSTSTTPKGKIDVTVGDHIYC